MNPLPRLEARTFLLVRAVCWDPHLDQAHLGGVQHSIRINPETRTNDRSEVCVEFNRTPVNGDVLEVRVVRTDEGRRVVHSFGGVVDTRLHEFGHWLFFTFPSLSPEMWEVGHVYAIELWTNDHRMAVRELPCVPIEDSF
jgi:hypothetical protein